MIDQSIIEKIKIQDEDGINELIDAYGSLIKSVIHKHLYNLQSYTDDCFNDVLLEIWDNIASFNSQKSSFKNWICVIARYRALNYVKKFAYKDASVDIEDMTDTLSYEDNTFENILLKEDLEELLQNLSKADRELFYKLFYEGFSTKEVACSENMSEDAIYKRVSRARKKMKEAKNEVK